MPRNIRRALRSGRGSTEGRMGMFPVCIHGMLGSMTASSAFFHVGPLADTMVCYCLGMLLIQASRSHFLSLLHVGGCLSDGRRPFFSAHGPHTRPP